MALDELVRAGAQHLLAPHATTISRLLEVWQDEYQTWPNCSL